MPKPKRLSGAEVIEILSQFGFTVYSQKGSHVKLRRVGMNGNETLTIPNHRELDTGTCKAIFRQASQYIAEAELHPYFYS
ncbi:type II toxin-antitoxin system HicA family toxin [Phormidesmis priestleyi ULC007]|uniref:Type II toxin-antitoxin system HicA family toxin n=1 Tax=Phormidesmis priestleyi ULC007 TaxID=1920490 RepID=A0A2T1DGS6_9CYAN|nr:type II toxin-antitoxin system HicA family toxin [Phormidesmis priestleyi]PSB19644.1 type II toxin-antitoxin system HicA family toxin [Phormidesmis priestleyi ULC007]PZO53528.1 MAG: type II toxin-antitoxin system HicA family toxin [Phormidesmis priestleyi]